MGGKGGPLAFLNKKGWHPGNQRNQEKVWKKEQEALAEQKQMEEIRKQYEEQRQREELDAVAVAAGVKLKQDRLDWMYQGGMVARQEAEKRADEQMLGEKDVQLKAVEETSKVDQLAQLPSFYTADTPASANEMWQRLHGDPMFAIKQQELAARKKIISNPVQMDAIRREVAAKAQAKAARKAAKAAAKAAKKDKKEKKKESKKAKRSAHSPSSSDDSEDDRPPKRTRTEHPPATQDRAHADTPRDAVHANGSSQHHREPERHREANDIRRGSAHIGNQHAEEIERRGRDLRWERSSERRERDRDRGRGDHHADREVDRHRSSKGAEQGEGERNGTVKRAEVHHDSASAQGRHLTYGLNHTADDVQDRAALRKETERRLQEAADRKAQEEKDKASQRYQRKEYRTGRLTEEEKAARLAEMTGNAGVHEEARWARLQAARKRDDSEAALEAAAKEKAALAGAAPGRHHNETAKFLSQATKEVYGAEGSNDASLADRVGRRKYFMERRRGEDAGAFQR